jgi:UDP-glucose 4-epimerase
MKILITGGSGYLGSSLYEFFEVGQTDEVKILCRRPQCNCKNWHLGQFADFDVVLHAAWPNVTGEYRQNRELQEQGYSFTVRLIESLNYKKLKKFVFFGSQAEIDNVRSISDEKTKRRPKSEYGKFKNHTHLYLQGIFSSIQYVHLIIYSLYGGNQGINWFIPMIIRNTKLNKDFRLKNPQYIMSFFNVENFCKVIRKIIDTNAFSEFIISSTDYKQLSDIHLYIYSRIYNEKKILYKKISDPKYIAGNPQKLFNKINFIEQENIYSFLEKYDYEGV